MYFIIWWGIGDVVVNVVGDIVDVELFDAVANVLGNVVGYVVGNVVGNVI